MKGQTSAFRLRALHAEQRARDASDPRVRAEWEQLAIEWHLLANTMATASGDAVQIDVREA